MLVIPSNVIGSAKTNKVKNSPNKEYTIVTVTCCIRNYVSVFNSILIYLCNLIIHSFVILTCGIAPTVRICKHIMICPRIWIKCLFSAMSKNIENIFRTNTTCSELCKIYLTVSTLILCLSVGDCTVVTGKPSSKLCRVCTGGNLKITVSTIVISAGVISCIITIHTNTV